MKKFYEKFFICKQRQGFFNPCRCALGYFAVLCFLGVLFSAFAQQQNKEEQTAGGDGDPQC